MHENDQSTSTNAKIAATGENNNAQLSELVTDGQNNSKGSENPVDEDYRQLKKFTSGDEVPLFLGVSDDEFQSEEDEPPTMQRLESLTYGPGETESPRSVKTSEVTVNLSQIQSDPAFQQWTYLFLSFGEVNFAPLDISQTSVHEVM